MAAGELVTSLRVHSEAAVKFFLPPPKALISVPQFLSFFLDLPIRFFNLPLVPVRASVVTQDVDFPWDPVLRGDLHILLCQPVHPPYGVVLPLHVLNVIALERTPPLPLGPSVFRLDVLFSHFPSLRLTP